jgi:hypothetical protein
MDYPPPPPGPPPPRDPPAPPTYPLPTSNVQPVAPPIPYQPQPPPPPTYQPAPPPAYYGQPTPYAAWRLPKNKSTAVLLAIFLGYVTWMYTYEKDAWKFWTAFAITLANIILSLITFGVWLFVAIPAGIGIWIWGIVDVAAKPQQFYDLYPAA